MAIEQGDGPNHFWYFGSIQGRPRSTDGHISPGKPHPRPAAAAGKCERRRLATNLQPLASNPAGAQRIHLVGPPSEYAQLLQRAEDLEAEELEFEEQ